MPSNPESSGGGQEEKVSGAKRSKEKPVFDKKTLQALLKLHSENFDEEQGIKERIAEVLSLSDKEITRAITSAVRAVREDVQYLLECAEKGKATKGFSFDADAVHQRLDQEDTPVSLSELSQWKNALSAELSSRGKDPDEMLKKKFEERVTDRKFQQDQRVLSQVEIAFLLDAIARNRAGKVEEALTEMPESKEPQEMLSEVRKRLYELLPQQKVHALLPQPKEFNAMKKLDVLRKEIHDAKEEQEYQELSGRILACFGRREKQEPLHTLISLEKSLKVYGGRVERTLGRMNQEGKIAFMVNADGQTVYFCRDQKVVKYTTGELVDTLDPQYFDKAGKFLHDALNEGEIVDKDYLADHAHDLQLPADIAGWIFDCYVDVKRLRRTRDKGYQMPDGDEEASLSSTVFERIGLAHQFYELATALDDQRLEEVSKEVTWETIEKDYQKFHAKRSVSEIPLKTAQPSLKVHPFTEIQFGHKDLDVKALRRRIEELKALPEDQRPHQILVSGLLFGRFKHWEKDKHKVKVYEMDKQLRNAKFVLDELSALGIPIIYNMSDNDALIVKEYTYDAVELIEGFLKGGKDFRSAKRHLARGAAYWQFEQAQRSKAWPQHYAFQWDVILPYMLRSGRHLYSAEEVQERCGEGGGGGYEEYFLLLYAYKKRKDGESLEKLAKEGDKLAKMALQVLQMENIPFHGEEQEGKIIVTSDFILNAETEGRKRTLEEKHSWRQSGVAMVADPMKAARAIYDQFIADGEEVPDMVIGENEQHAIGVLKRHNDGHFFMATTPGLQTFNRKSSSYTRLGSDKSERMAWVRGERFIAGTTSFEITDDDRYKIEFLNDKFMDIAAKTTERMIGVVLSDFQLGSVTADFDTAIKCIDYVFYQLLAGPKAKAVIFFNGDLIQGWNYPKFPIENARMGLVGTGRQQKLLVRVLENILNTLPREIKERIELVDFTDGNHEWNSPGKRAEIGISHSLPFAMAFENASEGTYKTNLCDYDVPVVTKDGSRFISTVAFEKIQGYGFLVQHIHQHRGGKGSGGGPPVYMAKALIEGVAPHLPGAHVLIGSHYHWPNYLQYDNKVAAVNGSWARESEFEFNLGCCPTMGTLVWHVGGGKPLTMEIITAETLYKYKMNGYYKDEDGCDTDKGHDPRQHTFANMLMNDARDPMSGVQKKLMKDMQELKKERKLY